MVILALDYGERRIGVAASDRLAIAAHALGTIERTHDEADMDAIAEMARQKEVDLIVVGLPINMDGSIGPQAHKVRGFIKSLKRRLPGVPIDTVDERLSTAEAERCLAQMGASLRRRKENVDRMAAQILLRRYLERLAHASSKEEELR